MRSTVLVSRILRLLETDGQIGDGTALADAFAEAVESANRRLEEVDLALLANQGSEAMRLVEEPPRLLDEVGVLDFPQFSDWVALCAERGWTKAAAIDQTRLEKVLDVSRSATMVEPALKRYRKAMRTNDQELLLQSLRSLADADKSQDWATELRKAEAAAQGKLLATFRTARDAKDEEGVERAVEALLDGRWSAPPEERIAAEPLAWRKKRDDERRRRELAEDLFLLREVKATWKRARAESLLRHMDELKTFGVAVPKEDEELVESVRARCDKERAEAEAQARWDAAMEQLRIAVGRGDPDEIQDALAAEAFGERDPEDEVRERAEETLQRFEDAHRRKVRFLAACLLLALCGVLALAGLAFAKKQFEARCVAAVARLQRLVDAPKAHETLAAALSALEGEDPKVRRDPRVRTFDDRLKEIVDAREARLAEAGRRLAALAEAETADWPENETDWERELSETGSFLLDEDTEQRTRLSALELSFRKTTASRNQSLREQAESSLAKIETAGESASGEARTSFPSDSIQKKLDKVRTAVADWKKTYAEGVPDFVPRADAVSDTIREAERAMDEAGKALAALREAGSFDEFLLARNLLKATFSDRVGVSQLRDLPVSASSEKDLVAGSLPSQTRFASREDSLMDDGEFRDFANDEIVEEFQDNENWIAQHLIYTTDKFSRTKVHAISKGRAEIHPETRSNKKVFVTTGTLLVLKDLSVYDELPGNQEKPLQELSAFSRQYSDVVDQARRSELTTTGFADWLFERLDSLAKEGKQLLEEDLKPGVEVSRERLTAYGRVRVMKDFLDWLEEIGLTSYENGAPGSDTFRKIRDKAADITIPGVDPAYVWACLPDSRISARNRECAELINSLPDGFFRQTRNRILGNRRLAIALSDVSVWRPSFVGATTFNPGKPDSVNLDAPKADKGLPVYVVREENGNVFLKRAFVPSTAKPGSWALAKGMTGELLAAEPLFQVHRNGKPINVDAEIGKILKNAPPGSEREFSKNNFWIEWVK